MFGETALSSILLGWLRDRIFQKWATLIFEMILSAVLAFLFVCGGMLVTGVHPAIAIGSGMLTSGAVMLALFNGSDLTKKMRIVIPELTEAEKEILAHTETIQR